MTRHTIIIFITSQKQVTDNKTRYWQHKTWLNKYSTPFSKHRCQINWANSNFVYSSHLLKVSLYKYTCRNNQMPRFIKYYLPSAIPKYWNIAIMKVNHLFLNKLLVLPRKVTVPLLHLWDVLQFQSCFFNKFQCWFFNNVVLFRFIMFSIYDEMLLWLLLLYAVETKHFFAVTLIWKPTWVLGSMFHMG